ncbi:hypothetical protein JG688_00009391 [Phytophthora aleatoria]|uniref:Trs120/TRAPPC9 N-terminal domain-containing protein n=1 Tax=Phytophthora aleatoria TaxID=2496075 RepID=A0A8J5IRG6_9STRA|nr:hypothetical protein JG688_00009391 [Phytophthora aleatoria]
MSSSAPPPRWKRPAEFLVYLVPVGSIPSDLFASYARLLQTHSDLPLRSLTRPGGYAAELSPFRGLDWTGKGSLHFHFVSTAEHVESCDGEDVHASRRVIGALGVCHSPSLTLSGGLRAAHAQFEASVRRFPGLLMHKLFAFEHTFEDVTSSECEGLSDLVMFPSASSQQAVKSDFFYSPFEKQKMKRKTGDSGEESDSDDAPAMYEKGFPVYERIELQLTLSNPTGVAVKLQEVRAWVTFAANDGSTNTTATDGFVECYPCLFTLEPYQKRKMVVLGIQPLRVGTFHVRGCFIKAFNIKTSFQLQRPVNIHIVGELPMVSLSLREHGTMALLDGKKTTEPVASKIQIAMFSSETRRCMLRVRSTGNQQITNYRLAVTLQHRRAAKKTCVVYNNLPSATDDISANGRRASEPPDGQIETKTLVLRCGKVVSSPLPLTSGDFVSIPFEVSLRGNYGQQEPMDEDIQIEWSFVYADEAGNSVDAVFYRETKARLFQYVPITVTIQRADSAVSGIDVEVRITEEGEELEKSDHVMVVGLLKTQVRWDEPMDRSAKLHEIQCMFVSEGNFRVTVVQAAFPALSAPFSLDNRHFSTSDAVPPTLELTMADGQLTDVAAAASSDTGNEPWVIVQGVQSVLETVHTTTGLPWWATLLLSGVTVRAAIFPYYVFQIQAMQSEVASSEYFQIRKLLWDELRLNVRPSEEEELRSAIGSHLIEGNENLRQELAVLVEILTEFQQQNDDIRVWISYLTP